MDNNVTVTGNITRDPELRFTPSGQPVANFSVAVNRRWQNRQSQEWEEATSFFDITAWAQLAENVSESLTRGMRVTITGRLDQRSWETPEGDKRSKVEIVADDVAPSLKWATAQVTKNERRDGGNFSGGGGGQSAPQQAASAPAASGGYDLDEEPF